MQNASPKLLIRTRMGKWQRNFPKDTSFYSVKSFLKSRVTTNFLIFPDFRGKRLLNESFRPEFRHWFSSCYVGGLGRLFYGAGLLLNKVLCQFFKRQRSFHGTGTLQPKQPGFFGALFLHCPLKISPSHHKTSVDKLFMLFIVG